MSRRGLRERDPIFHFTCRCEIVRELRWGAESAERDEEMARLSSSSDANRSLHTNAQHTYTTPSHTRLLCAYCRHTTHARTEPRDLLARLLFCFAAALLPGEQRQRREQNNLLEPPLDLNAVLFTCTPRLPTLPYAGARPFRLAR